MTLRTRLWLVLGTLVLVPLLVGVFLVLVLIPRGQREATTRALQATQAAAVDALAQECRQVGLAARALALEAVAASPDAALATVRDGGYGDYAALLDDRGQVMEQSGALPAGLSAATLPSCRAAPGSAAVIAESVSVTGRSGLRAAVVATTLDRTYLERLLLRLRFLGRITVRSGEGDRVLASATSPSMRRSGAVLSDRRAGDAAVPFTVVVDLPEPGRSSAPALVALVALVAVAAATLPVLAVARSLTGPLEELTEATERVIRGDLHTQVPVRRDDEVGRVGRAFNRMTQQLRRNLDELSRSRNDLRDSLERIGETLTATHDRDGLLQVVLETAVATVGARCGLVLLQGKGQALSLVAHQGLVESGRELPDGLLVGAGVLGRVAASGEVMRGSLGSSPRLRPERGEPDSGEVLAVPLKRHGRSFGVLALYDRTDASPFDERAEESIRTLAGQAGIAVDNVLLHLEAERLSITDPLTGMWNFRYLSMSLAREIERASRFDRPLAVLMLDLDHFKEVNDRYGHARGDGVLRELARRVHGQIREVDTLARYGGEEFVLVLPETAAEGAGRLAERICAAVRNEPFAAPPEEPLKITVSIGGAAYPRQGMSAAMLMRAADQALYVAKREGRDRWHISDR